MEDPGIERPLVELDLHDLSDDEADAVAELVVKLGGIPQMRYGDAGPAADIVEYIVMVVTPMSPFLDGVLQAGGFAVMNRVLDRLPRRDGRQAITDGAPDSEGTAFLFTEDSPTPEERESALRGMSDVDLAAYAPGTVLVWDSGQQRWHPSPAQ